jgi:hypothetical protein
MSRAATLFVAAGAPGICALGAILDPAPEVGIPALVLLACGLILAGLAAGRWRLCWLPSIWIGFAMAVDALTLVDVISRPQDDWIPVTLGAVVAAPAGALAVAIGVALRGYGPRAANA